MICIHCITYQNRATAEQTSRYNDTNTEYAIILAFLTNPIKSILRFFIEFSTRMAVLFSFPFASDVDVIIVCFAFWVNCSGRREICDPTYGSLVEFSLPLLELLNFPPFFWRLDAISSQIWERRKMKLPRNQRSDKENSL